MPIGDIIGGATSAGSAPSPSSDGPSLYRAADSAGEAVRGYLNEHTPGGVEWTLNFAFIVTVLTAASAGLSLYTAVA